MNRDIEFRGVCIDTKEWVYGYYVKGSKRHCIQKSLALYPIFNIIPETLGQYKTKKRVLEVLDEIQNILKPKYILDSSSIKPNGDSWVENGIVMQNYNANARIEELSTYVYEMPKD